LRFPLASIALGNGALPRFASPPREGPVLVGIRPEDFEDSGLASDRQHGIRVHAHVDVLESTGSDVYAHLRLEGADGQSVISPVLEELAAATDAPAEDLAPTAGDVIARLDSASRIREGGESELWMDTTRLHLFDPDSGSRLE
jgi:multiple sugar transport system ATP-binding protein